MHDPELLTREIFATHQDTTFYANVRAGVSVPIKLVEVSESKKSGRTERFSLLFEGSADQFLPQQMYPLDHEHIGTFDLFIVPVFKEQGFVYYEALFNRVLDLE